MLAQQGSSLVLVQEARLPWTASSSYHSVSTQCHARFLTSVEERQLCSLGPCVVSQLRLSFHSLGHMLVTDSQVLFIFFLFFEPSVNVDVFLIFIYLFWPCSEACGILVPWPGIKPILLQWKQRVLTTGPPGKSHSRVLLHSGYLEFILIALSMLLFRYPPPFCLVILVPSLFLVFGFPSVTPWTRQKWTAKLMKFKIKLQSHWHFQAWKEP